MNTKFAKKLSKKGISAAILAAGIMGISMAPNAYAHGFVEKPASRAALCSQNYGALNLMCGNIMYEPQSLEAPKGFPQSGRLMEKSHLLEVYLVAYSINKPLIVGLRTRLQEVQIPLHGSIQRHI